MQDLIGSKKNKVPLRYYRHVMVGEQQRVGINTLKYGIATCVVELNLTIK